MKEDLVLRLHCQQSVLRCDISEALVCPLVDAVAYRDADGAVIFMGAAVKQDILI